MSEPRSIPTTFNGIQYASRLEARWALFLDRLSMEYKYEPKGMHTLPDFEVTTSGMSYLIEIKGQMANDEYIRHLSKLKVDYLCVGGFFRFNEPIIIHVREAAKTLPKLRPRPFRSIFFLKYLNKKSFSAAFYAACKHRFDLR